jgi:hypothetical protein
MLPFSLTSILFFRALPLSWSWVNSVQDLDSVKPCANKSRNTRNESNRKLYFICLRMYYVHMYVHMCMCVYLLLSAFSAILLVSFPPFPLFCVPYSVVLLGWGSCYLSFPQMENGSSPFLREPGPNSDFGFRKKRRQDLGLGEAWVSQNPSELHTFSLSLLSDFTLKSPSCKLVT